MTPQEFKAWFDGFTENVDKAPTQKQWARIKERVAEIDGKAVTERVYVDRYLPTYPTWPRHVGPIWTTCNATATAANTSASALNARTQTSPAAFDGMIAMNVLGKADAASLS